MSKDDLPSNLPAIKPSIADQYEERRAILKARYEAEQALPDEVKRLLDGMRWRLLSGGRGSDYTELKRLSLEIWGGK
jgi:hypothetical protein